MTHDTQSAAEYLKCEPSTIRSLINAGELAAAKIGRGYVIRQQTLDDFLIKKEQSTAQAVSSNKETSLCQFTSDKQKKAGCTTLTLQHQAGKELDALLVRKMKKPRKNSTIN